MRTMCIVEATVTVFGAPIAYDILPDGQLLSDRTIRWKTDAFNTTFPDTDLVNQNRSQDFRTL